MIDRIDIESSSRRILSMSRDAIFAAYSDHGYEQRMQFERGVHMHRNGLKKFPKNHASNSADPITIYIPLLFSVFDQCGNSLATGFTEPIRVSIKFAPSFAFLFFMSFFFRLQVLGFMA